MRFLLVNTVRDPRTLSLRRQYPGKVAQRPILGDIPLVPASTKVLRLPDFTAKMLDDIDRYVAIGNVALLQVGKNGGPADTDATRAMLGIPVKTTKVEAPAEPPAPTPTEEPTKEPLPPLEMPWVEDPAYVVTSGFVTGSSDIGVMSVATQGVVQVSLVELALHNGVLADVYAAATKEPAASEAPAQGAQEACSICGELYVAPVSLHHTEDECAANVAEKKHVAGDSTPSQAESPPVTKVLDEPGFLAPAGALPVTKAAESGSFSAEELGGMPYGELKSLYADLGGKPGNKSRAKLIDDILAGMG